MAATSIPLPGTLSVRALVLGPFFEYFANDTGNMRKILRRVGLSESVFRDPYAAIPLQAYLQALELAAEVVGDPHLGARLGSRMRPGNLAATGLRAVQAGTIRRGLEALARHSSALQGGTRVTLEQDGAHLILSYMITAPLDVMPRQDAEFTLAGMCRLIRGAFDPRWHPVEVHFRHPAAAGSAVLERLFKAPVRFSRPGNAIIMAAAEADRVRRIEDFDLIALIERHLMDLAEEVRPGSIGEQVEELISLYLGVRPIDLTMLAEMLRMSPRNLQRRLAAEGLTLRGILQAQRMRRAQSLLQDGGQSVDAVATALGYADGTVFWRAWRGWTGSNPGSVGKGVRPPRSPR